MALKFISFAELLPKTGGGGVRRDGTGQANTHAGVAVPLASERASPPPSASGEPGARLNLRGGIDRQQPCGFQAPDPTDPTDPTSFEGMACLSSFNSVASPINAASVNDAWRVWELKHGPCEFGTAMNSDMFYPWPEDCPAAFPTHELAGCIVKPPVVPFDLMAWKTPAASYHAHHFICPTCIAAGRGSRYGQRCGAGMALWRAYVK